MNFMICMDLMNFFMNLQNFARIKVEIETKESKREERENLMSDGRRERKNRKNKIKCKVIITVYIYMVTVAKMNIYNNIEWLM